MKPPIPIEVYCGDTLRLFERLASIIASRPVDVATHNRVSAIEELGMIQRELRRRGIEVDSVQKPFPASLHTEPNGTVFTSRDMTMRNCPVCCERILASEKVAC